MKIFHIFTLYTSNTYEIDFSGQYINFSLEFMSAFYLTNYFVSLHKTKYS